MNDPNFKYQWETTIKKGKSVLIDKTPVLVLCPDEEEIRLAPKDRRIVIQWKDSSSDMNQLVESLQFNVEYDMTLTLNESGVPVQIWDLGFVKITKRNVVGQPNGLSTTTLEVSYDQIWGVRPTPQ